MKIELTIVVLKTESIEAAYVDKVSDGDIIRVLSQLPFMIARLMKFIRDNEPSYLTSLQDDDIPF